MSQSRNKSKKSRNICTWIRERTSPYCFGVKAKAGNPAHCNKNDNILYQFQCLKMGWYGRRLCRLKNKDMADHFAGKKTYYFTADGRSSVPEVLVNIDVDCHGSGSLKGAIAFAEHLRGTKFPNLYYETSTNGNGAHGYIVVEKGNLGDEGLNGALVVLDRWLKAELEKGDWDVENVEIKAHCPEFTWGKEKYELKGYKSGQLAKLPREALTRADELRGTTKVAVDDLRRLQVPLVQPESEDSVVCMKKKSATKKPVVSVPESENWEAGSSAVLAKPGKTRSGSISGRHFGDDELSKLKDGYLPLSRELLAGEVLIAKGRRIVTEEDMAIFLMLLRFFSNNMNADGSLPVARWREMWSALFGASDVGRAWCHHRFATMRNFLSDRSLIAWDDEDFFIGVLDDDGRFVPGKAAKWKAGEELMVMMDAVDGQEAGIGSVVASDVAGDEVVEEKERGRVILYGHKQDHLHLYPTLDDQGNLTEGAETTDHTQTTHSQGQSASFQSFLDDFGLWVPVPRPRFAGHATSHYRMAA